MKVHFLQDALGCDCVHGRAMNLVRRAGVQLEIFRFINVAMNFRTHRKLLVIDGRTGYLGGTGIADDWKGDGRTPWTLARLTLLPGRSGRRADAAGVYG